MSRQSIYSCGLCHSPYDEKVHKPLSLPCGDVFCEECLGRLGRSEEIKCPVHQVKIVRSLRELPVCLPLFKSLSPQRAAVLHCSLHPQKRVKYRCLVHEKYLCTMCIVTHTGVGHAVEGFEATVQGLRLQSEELRKVANRRATTMLEVRKALEAEERRAKSNYEVQVRSVNLAYDEVVIALNSKRKSHLTSLKDCMAQHMAHVETEKAKVMRMTEATSVLISKLNKLSLDAPMEDVVKDLCELQKDCKRFEDCRCPELALPVFHSAVTFSDGSTIGVKPKSPDLPTPKAVMRTGSAWLCKACSTANSPEASGCPRCFGDTCFSQTLKMTSQPMDDLNAMEATVPLFAKSEQKMWGTLPRPRFEATTGKETLRRGQQHRRTGRRKRNNSF